MLHPLSSSLSCPLAYQRGLCPYKTASLLCSIQGPSVSSRLKKHLSGIRLAGLSPTRRGAPRGKGKETAKPLPPAAMPGGSKRGD